MRFHVLASDYDGTLAQGGQVSHEVLEKLQALKSGNRKLILVTGRELPDLEKVFPENNIFDHIVAENGALLYTPSTGKEELLGEAPDKKFIQALQDKGIKPLSVGKVIVATWEPFQHAVLEVIKSSGIERQVIFNKGAVMILPPGVNKATGLQTLLQQLHFSEHNTVAIGDAENDSAMMLIAECCIAVSNALPSLKESADFVTREDHGKGVMELANMLMENDLATITEKQTKNNIVLGTCKDGSEFSIRPYRNGILLTGTSGGGKSTLTASITESLTQKGYQFCLIDPEGDYLELPNAVVVGNDKTVSDVREISELLKNPKQNLVICIMSVPMQDRPQFFQELLSAIIQCRRDYGHPHWLLIDEAHHLLPNTANTSLFEELYNFILISFDVAAISHTVLKKTGTAMIVGQKIAEALTQYCNVLGKKSPQEIPGIELGEVFVYDVNKIDQQIVTYNPPKQLQQRHKRKYAFGEMGDNNFIFTGKENKLNLKANNLAMFVHIAEGIDDDTWMYHLKRNDYADWFSAFLHDDELMTVAKKAENKNAAESKKMILDFISKKYMA